MVSFWSQFLLDASPFENCAVVTKEGHRYTTHKLLAARHGFLRTLMAEEDPGDLSVLFLPDFSLEEVVEAFEYNRPARSEAQYKVRF
jgi:hypothetical protein